jgi:hypothetical protein
MHRAAAPTAQTAGSAEDFRKGSLHVAAFRESVTVPPMAREERILSGEMRANPDSHGFLARR